MSSLATRLGDLITAIGADIKALSYKSVPFSSGGSLIVKVGATGWTNRLNRTLTIVEVYAEVGTAPTGASIICDVNKNGSTIWSTQANRVAIAATSLNGNSTTFNTTSIAQGDRLTFDVDQIGSTIAGSDLTLQVVMK